MGQKSLAYSYLLWAAGGPWGLHHVYLGRYRQAFLWLTTLGGFIGMGWIRDLWRMPDYVAEANRSTDYTEAAIQRMRAHPKPPVSLARIGAEIVYGSVVGAAIVAGLPQDVIQGDLGTAIMSILVPFGVGLAVHLVANIGREKADLKWAIGGAYAAAMFFYVNLDAPMSSITQSALASAIFINWKGKSWRRTKYKKFTKSLCLGLTVAGILYFSCWISALLHNAYVTTSDGEEIRLKDALGNLKDSEAWKHPLDTMSRLWGTYGATGFDNMWSEFVQAIDPEGESSAYQILGVSPGASEKTLRSAYRDLVKKYHPDRVSDPEKKLQVQEHFIAIQKAFDTLSTINNRRSKANRANRNDG